MAYKWQNFIALLFRLQLLKLYGKHIQRNFNTNVKILKLHGDR